MFYRLCPADGQTCVRRDCRADAGMLCYRSNLSEPEQSVVSPVEPPQLKADKKDPMTWEIKVY